MLRQAALLLARPRPAPRLLLHTSPAAKATFEPDYLDAAGPGVPTYPPLNIQVKGYNFDILESVQSYIHNLSENMGVTVEKAWATPAKTFNMNTFQVFTSALLYWQLAKARNSDEWPCRRRAAPQSGRASVSRCTSATFRWVLAYCALCTLLWCGGGWAAQHGRPTAAGHHQDSAAGGGIAQVHQHLCHS